jgi:hypothetical protein
MEFQSLSEAVRYFSKVQTGLIDLPPNSTLAVQVNQIPPTTNYLTPEPVNAITYGKTIWGVGKITDISRPII